MADDICASRVKFVSRLKNMGSGTYMYLEWRQEGMRRQKEATLCTTEDSHTQRS